MPPLLNRSKEKLQNSFCPTEGEHLQEIVCERTETPTDFWKYMDKGGKTY